MSIIFSTSKYENITLIGDFNVKPANKNFCEFSDMDQLEHLMWKLTNLNVLRTSLTIGLILTNYWQNVMKSDVYETDVTESQRFLQNPIKHPRWNFCEKQLTNKSAWIRLWKLKGDTPCSVGKLCQRQT